MIETITFNTGESKLSVLYEDGTIKEYTESDAALYVQDNPDREADIVAMGWLLN